MRHPSRDRHEGDKRRDFKCDWVRSLDEVGIIYELRASDGLSETCPRKRWQQKWAYRESRSLKRKPLNSAEILGDIL
jgi:hypothetical protein